MEIRTPGGRFETRGITATSTFAGWNDSLSVTGVVPPHGYDYVNRAGVNVTPRTVLSIGVVQRCLEVLQNAFFVMGPPRSYTKAFDKDGLPYKKWVSETTGTYPQILNGPWGTSPFADKAPVAYNVGAGRTVASMGLFGEAWWLITTRDTHGNASALEPLHPSFLVMKTDPTASKLQSIWYGMGNNRVELTPADLVHIPRLILPGDRSGINPIQSEAPLFAIAIAAVQYSQMWFAQGGQASYVLSTPDKLGQDEIDRIFEHILLEHSGLNKAYTPLILDSGVKPVPVQVDPEKSQMNETLQYVRSELAGYFGIPEHLVGGTGDTGNVWGKGIQEENFSLVDFTLSGYRVPIEEAFSSIIPKGQFAAVNERRLLRANSMDQSKVTLANRTAVKTTPNEERRATTLPPLDTPAADSITTPLNSNMPPPATGGGTAAGGAAGGTAGGGGTGAA
jgi:HK97 family phage portal protein